VRLRVLNISGNLIHNYAPLLRAIEGMTTLTVVKTDAHREEIE
jgi:hypothetical protein